MKIFVSAYACEPYKGSEPGIGWSFVNEMSNHHEVHVLTRANNKISIDEALKENDKQNLIFHYYDVPKWLSFWKKKRRGYQAYYYLWQVLAYLKYKDYINNSNFDVVHHLTFGADWMPSLFMNCKSYTIYGPVGSEDTPGFIYKSLPLKLKVKDSIRTIVKKFFYHFEPLRARTIKSADLILSHSSRFSKYTYPSIYQHKLKSHTQTGLNTGEKEYEFISEYKRHSNNTTRLIIASELVDWKGVRISAEVFSRIASQRDDLELVVLGEGPQKDAMVQIFDKYNVQSKVSFKGYVDKQNLMTELYHADLLLYPAYHHGLATIILQSMYSYLPIIGMDGDIISDVIHKKCGLSASGDSIEDVIIDLVKNTTFLIDAPEVREKYALQGRTMVESDYSWVSLVDSMNTIYKKQNDR